MFFNDLKRRRGKVTINPTWCKGCGFCVQYCPKNVLDLSSEFNAKGYHPPYVKHPENCHSCMFCQMICPEFTIYVTEEEVDDATEQGGAKAC